MQTLWLYLHFPSLQLDSLYQQAEQNVSEQGPVIVLNTNSNEVVQLNQMALKEGISNGMGLATAAALAPHLSVIPYRAETEEEKLKELAELLYLVTSDIALYKPDGLLLRIHNMLTLYGGLQPYWAVLQQQLASQKLRYQYATGHSPLAARMFSKAGFKHISEDINWLKKKVSQCQLKQTDLSHKSIEQLNRVGTHTVGELLAIPRKDIAKRFDIHLINYLGRLTGEFHHPIEFYHPKEKFSRYLELLFDIEQVQTLVKPLQSILNNLEQFMQVREQVTYNLQVTLYQRDALPQELTIGSAQGDYQADAWITLINLKLENITLDAPVFAIQISTGVVQQRTTEINDLFGKQGHHLSYAQLISLLAAKLGEEALNQPQVQDDHRPEYAVSYSTPGQTSTKQIISEPSFERFRPTFLLQQPQALREKTRLLHGPERICSGWWEHAPVTRDYYIARSEQGRYYWVFRTPEQKWFLHGVFS